MKCFSIFIPLTTAAAAAAAAIGPYAVRGMAKETERQRSRFNVLQGVQTHNN